ncbi:DUF169 domain-containing protein [Methanobrevibacter sp. DSM 116169]|uniref:DUF169 domain-containing protein n=1 Tax=Methanobrevibacter sp. DSM 116169 TaxID=3242727 RepID=UPI0038FC0BFB
MKNEKMSEILSEKLDLDGDVVAIKFINSVDEVPDDISKIADKKRHCEMVKAASFGEKFYATPDEQACKGGSAALGLEDFPEKLVSGETYFKLGRFKDLETSKKTIDDLYVVDKKHFGIVYSPLKEAKFIPDVIVMFAKPKAGMKIAQASAYSEGSKFKSSFAGIQSICGDVVSGPYMTGKSNISLACDGSRKHAKVKDEELIIGINFNEAEELVSNLNSI